MKINRKKILLSILFIILFSQCNSLATKKLPTIDWVNPQIVKFLSKEKLQVILQATEVRTYLTESTATSSTGLNGYGITGMGNNLSPSEINILKNLVVDSKGYNFSIKKRCMIMPKFGFSFHYKKQQVNLLISFQCKQWLFTFAKDKPQGFKLEDFDQIKSKLEKLVKRIFPKETLLH